MTAPIVPGERSEEQVECISTIWAGGWQRQGNLHGVTRNGRARLERRRQWERGARGQAVPLVSLAGWQGVGCGIWDKLSTFLEKDGWRAWRAHGSSAPSPMQFQAEPSSIPLATTTLSSVSSRVYSRKPPQLVSSPRCAREDKYANNIIMEASSTGSNACNMELRIAWRVIWQLRNLASYMLTTYMPWPAHAT
jgi:hypothetical protein